MTARELTQFHISICPSDKRILVSLSELISRFPSSRF